MTGTDIARQTNRLTACAVSNSQPETRVVADLAASRDRGRRCGAPQSSARGKEAARGRQEAWLRRHYTPPPRNGRPRRAPRPFAEIQVGSSQGAVHGPRDSPGEHSDQRGPRDGHLPSALPAQDAEAEESQGAPAQSEEQTPPPRRIPSPAIGPRDARGRRAGHGLADFEAEPRPRRPAQLVPRTQRHRLARPQIPVALRHPGAVDRADMKLSRAGRRHTMLLFEDERARAAPRSKLAPRIGPWARRRGAEAGQATRAAGAQRTHARAAGGGQHGTIRPQPATSSGAGTSRPDRRHVRRIQAPPVATAMPCHRGAPSHAATSPASTRFAQKRIPTTRRRASTGKRASPDGAGGTTPPARARARSGATRSTSPVHSPSGPLSRTRAGSASHTAGVQMARVRAAKVNGGGLPPRATRGRGRPRHRTTRAAKVPRGGCSRSPRAGAR